MTYGVTDASKIIEEWLVATGRVAPEMFKNDLLGDGMRPDQVYFETDFDSIRTNMVVLPSGGKWDSLPQPVEIHFDDDMFFEIIDFILKNGNK